MGVVVVCGLLLLAGVLVTIRWGSFDIQSPPVLDRQDERTVGNALRRYIWWLSLLLWTTVITGVLVVGPAGRLAMRLLAATAGPTAQGNITEADEVVGRITVEGTIGFFVFTGLAGALLASLSYLVLRRWLPRGRLGGVVLGTMLLVVAGTRLEPLRRSNEDFDLVGPGWLSIAVFAAMAIVEGMAVVAVAGRMSRRLPLPGRGLRTLLPHVVLLILALGFFVLPFVVLIGLISAVVQQTKLPELLRSDRVDVVGRIALAIIAAIALPGFVTSIVDIAGRGP